MQKKPENASKTNKNGPRRHDRIKEGKKIQSAKIDQPVTFQGIPVPQIKNCRTTRYSPIRTQLLRLVAFTRLLDDNKKCPHQAEIEIILKSVSATLKQCEAYLNVRL